MDTRVLRHGTSLTRPKSICRTRVLVLGLDPCTYQPDVCSIIHYTLDDGIKWFMNTLMITLFQQNKTTS